MLGEIARLQTELISPDEINAAAQQFLTTYYMGQETNAAQTGESGRIRAHRRRLAPSRRRSSTGCAPSTPEDVRRVANIYMHNLQFVVARQSAKHRQTDFHQEIDRVDEARGTALRRRPVPSVPGSPWAAGTIRMYGFGVFQPCGYVFFRVLVRHRPAE